MTNFVKVTTTDKIPEGKMIKVDVKGINILLAKVKGKIYAIDNVCSHKECSLNEGSLSGSVVTCPCHAAKFDVRTGAGQKDTPWGPGQESFEVKVEGKNIFVKI